MDGGFGCTPGGESHAGQSMIYYSSFFLNITLSMLFNACTFIPFEDLLFTFSLREGSTVCV